MAEVLIKYYKFIREKAGFEGKIDLATTTKIPSTMAALEPDTPENIKKFKEAIKKITGDYPPEY
jgi:hypothetical protein